MFQDLITFKSPLLDVYYPNDTVQCNVRSWFSRRTNFSDTSIIVQRLFNDKTELELAKCPIASDTLTNSVCKANLVRVDCKERVKLLCSVESNQTDVNRVTEIKIAGLYI